MEFGEGRNLTLGEMMKPRSQIVTAPEGTEAEVAYSIMKERKVKKLLVVDESDHLKG